MARKKQEIALQKEINNQEEWEDLMNKEGLFIVDVYQEWCGPCKSIVSILRRIKNESGDDLLQFAVARSDTIDSLERYRGKCQPCFLFYGSGTLVEVIRGANPPEIEKSIKSHLENEHKVLKGEAERVEIKDPEFKFLDEAEKRALEEEEESEEFEREVTVALIKPDAVNAGKVDDIIQKLEEHGIEILEHQERHLTEEEARDFYRHLEEQEWFEKMITYMTSGPSHVLVIAKGNSGIISEFRELLGPADVSEAKENYPVSLRALFGSESFQNAVHGADSGEKASRELEFFFPEFSVPKYKVQKQKKVEQHDELQFTVALIRPDAYHDFKDDILKKIKEAGFEIAMQKETTLTREQVEEFYAEHKEASFFEELVLRMSSGPVVVLALAKQNAVDNWRNIIGEKDPKVAKEKQPDSLRAMFSKDDITINLIHGSDSPESAARELDFFFPTEHTLAIIKPDAYENRSDIIEKIKENGFTVADKRDIKFTQEMAEELYKEHKDRDYFNDLIEHMTGGNSIVLILSKQDAVQGWRSLMGETDPNQANDTNPESVRAIYGKDIKQNSVHGSSSKEHADKCIKLIFGDIEFGPDGKVIGGAADDDTDENTVLQTSDEEKVKMEAEEADESHKAEEQDEKPEDADREFLGEDEDRKEPDSEEKKDDAHEEGGEEEQERKEDADKTSEAGEETDEQKLETEPSDEQVEETETKKEGEEETEKSEEAKAEDESTEKQEESGDQTSAEKDAPHEEEGTTTDNQEAKPPTPETKAETPPPAEDAGDSGEKPVEDSQPEKPATPEQQPAASDEKPSTPDKNTDAADTSEAAPAENASKGEDSAEETKTKSPEPSGESEQNKEPESTPQTETTTEPEAAKDSETKAD